MEDWQVTLSASIAVLFCTCSAPTERQNQRVNNYVLLVVQYKNIQQISGIRNQFQQLSVNPNVNKCTHSH